MVDQTKFLDDYWKAVAKRQKNGIIKRAVCRKKKYTKKKMVKQGISTAGRNGFKYKQWRSKVLRINRYLCFHCGYKADVAHHIKEWALYPKLRFDVNNGIAVCEECHERLHPFLKTKEKVNGRWTSKQKDN